MRILILVPEQDRISGNWISAERFRQGLTRRQHQVRLIGVSASTNNLCQEVTDFAPDVALLLHAYRSGKPWLDAGLGTSVPFVTMLTGTDINLGFADPELRPTIDRVIRMSQTIMLQNPLLAERFNEHYPELAAHLEIVAPGIRLGTKPYNLREALGVADTTTVFLCPAGIRPVKMQIELIDLFAQSGLQSDLFHLAFCGPGMDDHYSQRFLQEIAAHPWTSYLGAIDPESMPSAMLQADVIVNNSLAEGLANSLVEAATLGRPILARNNPGNAAVVKPKSNGMLYENAAEFKERVQSLLNPEIRRQLSKPSADYDPERETSALEKLLSAAADNDIGKG